MLTGPIPVDAVDGKAGGVDPSGAVGGQGQFPNQPSDPTGVPGGLGVVDRGFRQPTWSHTRKPLGRAAEGPVRTRGGPARRAAAHGTDGGSGTTGVVGQEGPAAGWTPPTRPGCHWIPWCPGLGRAGTPDWRRSGRLGGRRRTAAGYAVADRGPETSLTDPSSSRRRSRRSTGAALADFHTVAKCQRSQIAGTDLWRGGALQQPG